MKMIKIILSGFVLALFTHSINAQTIENASLQDDFQTYLNVIHAKKGFSGEILVAKANDVLFRSSVGMASLEHELKITNGSKYKIASITKTFTGALVAMAQEEGQLNFEDKACKFIEDLSEKFKEVTIHQLLTHTSGLPHNEGITDYWPIKSKLQLNKEQAIAEINELDLLFTPGSKMHYSSLGYYLLSTILEVLYQDSFENIVTDKILRPLQMEETGSVNSLKIIPHMVSGYHLISDDSLVHAPYRNYSLLKGAGDMYSSATDLLKWNNSFLNNTLLSEDKQKLLFTTYAIPHSAENKNYGYGWFINSSQPEKYYHGGGTWGFSTYTALYPKDKISIIVLSNRSSLPIESIAGDIEKLVFNREFEMPQIEVAQTTNPINFQIYPGNFISDSGKMKLQITSINNKLMAQLAGNPAFEIYPKGQHAFFGKKVELAIEFEVENEVVTGLSVLRMGQTFHFKKL
ncbi:beta-lactamase family protein [Marivirga sp. S37H4]|uniref:Beta-lactamase family protein n=1 Tax=Marivirga aurantiaca TaxID=2802615 RepID=A0A934WZB4_9BACT|nr:serine hydrolase domain-containing protein [Marivirga aurantiaca]MBK6265652.1 beta-lactamase family protein [Marivirga aurantiaca]